MNEELFLEKMEIMLTALITFLLSSLYFSSLVANQGIFLPSEYQNNSGPQWEWAMSALQKISFSDGDKILDVGCGDGKITAFIADQNPRVFVVGLDISAEMLHYASQKFSANNLLFLEGSAASLPFTGQFDKLISLCTAHWIIEQKEALLSFKKSLKIGGALLVTIPAKRPTSLGPVSEQVARSAKWASYFPNIKQERVYYTADEYKILLESVGLQLISPDVSKSMLTFMNKEALLNYVRPLVSFVKHLSEPLQEEFINDVVSLQIIGADVIFSDGTIGFETEKMDIIALRE